MTRAPTSGRGNRAIPTVTTRFLDRPKNERSRRENEREIDVPEEVMAKMCPMSGCKSCGGMCVHDKMMLGMGLLIMVGAFVHWGLHLV